MVSDWPRIALAGKLASGKTTAAQALAEGLGFARMSLAGPLKEIAAEIADWLYESFAREADQLIDSDGAYLLVRMRDVLKDKTTLVGRRWLQWLGTDCMRKRLPDVWIQMLVNGLPADRPVVVDDARFINEFETLAANGFRLVRIETPEAERLARVARIYPQYTGNPALAAHPSEAELETFGGWDYVLEGGGPIEEFRERVVAWAGKPL